MGDEIINRIANSSLITFDLEKYYQPGERVSLDIKPLLEHELILREKSFRDFVKSHNWSQYQNKHVAINCSTDAIVPVWAYMLLGIALQPFAKTIIFGTLGQLEEKIFFEALTSVNWKEFQGLKVVIKGCSDVSVPESVYVEVSTRLRPFAFSIMFGEACSSVPLFKKKQGNVN